MNYQRMQHYQRVKALLFLADALGLDVQNEDNEGQIIIYTGMKFPEQGDDDSIFQTLADVVPIDDDVAVDNE